MVETSPAASVASGSRLAGLSVPLFCAAILLSAFLLFAIQPMFAKMVLPILGGTPAVWSVAMVFFQALLLAGYAYAHALARHVPARLALPIHLGVMAVAWLALPIGIAAGWGDPPTSGHAVWLIGLFAVSVGLPFFAVAGNGPLLQAWFAASGHPGARDPYFLYAASNLGSFAALLAYPLGFEPLLTLSQQASAWTAGFVLLGIIIAACGLASLPPGRAPALRGEAVTAAPTMARRAAWIGLAFVPSGLLVAVTAHISTDVAAAPLLWVLPLGLYLLTFVLAFRTPPLVDERMLAAFLAYGVVTAILTSTMSLGLWGLGLHLWLFLVAALLCHGRLFALRPAADRLTDFYLCLSAGGVLGGIFAGLLAPKLFPTVLEYPLLLAAALFCRPGIVRDPDHPWRRELAGAAVGLLLAALLAWLAGLVVPPRQADMVGLAAIGAAAALSWRIPRRAAVLGATLILGSIVSLLLHADTRYVRSFFGVHKIYDVGAFRVLGHGTTIHGAMRVRDAAGAEVSGRPEPTTYYSAGGPLSDALEAGRSAAGHADTRVAVVGLGTGSLACHARAGESWRYFEIDPEVLRIARDPALFRFLSECLPDVPVVLGDARLTLAKDHGTYDVLVLDAFSSDAIPAHLLTSEAVALYAARLSPDGVLVFHVSNRHFDLRPALARIAASQGLAAYGRLDATASNFADTMTSGSMAVAMARPGSRAEAELESRGYRRLEPDMTRSPWTDDYANLLEAMLDSYRQR